MNQAFQNTKDFAVQMDQNDSLAKFREQFIFPTNAEGEVQVYLCGNSLGLQPKSAKKALENELEDWAKWGVEGHFHGKNLGSTTTNSSQIIQPKSQAQNRMK